MLDLETSVVPRIYRGKRLLDLAVVCLVTIPAIVIGLICALAILCEDGRPVLLRQTRTGLAGRPFPLFKLRTMARETPPESEVPDVNYITGVGMRLRRLSLDELPQLINVARGDMSLVGPRPYLRHLAQRYDERQVQRLAAMPGLTGLAQVSGRNRLTYDERAELDLLYVTRQSLRLDLKILARSVRVVLTGDGMYGHPGADEDRKSLQASAR